MIVRLNILPGPTDSQSIQDRLGRSIGYLRISLTAACAMRCTYCRPKTLAQPKNEQRLSPAELEAMTRHLVTRHGLTKVRLTGGDPTSRPELVEIITRLSSIEGLDELAMTTNGLTLPKHAQDYARAGLDRLNISLDTLDSQRFTTLTGVDGLARVLEGIEAAQAAGLTPIKLNCVVIRGQNDRDLISLVHYATDHGLRLRFIELMPMGPLADQWADRYVRADQMREILSPAVTSWEKLPQGSESATHYRIMLPDGRVTTIGFITPMSCNFCAQCDRLRIAADGRVYPCLMDRPAGTLLSALRPSFDGDRMDQILQDAYQNKSPEHPAHGFGIMTRIGG
jgi:cyclic pyranopterin phosphate synthase